MINYDSVIEQLTGAGLILDGGLVADGVVRRCKTTEDRERRGWYCLHEWQSAKGNRYVVGSYGVWHGKDNGAMKIELGKDQQISQEEQAALRKRIAEDKKKAKAARATRNKKAAMRAASTWRKLLTAPPDGVDVDYLQRKGVRAHGVRYTDSGAIAIPMMDPQYGVHGLQFILPSHHERRKKTGRDKEYWPTGLAKQGHFYLIGNLVADGICLVAEGYATAATLHEETGHPVAVAFDANNILPVVKALTTAYKGIRILICADDDYIQKCRSCLKMTTVETDDCIHCGDQHGKQNAGVLAASAAALEVNGSWVTPQFPSDRAGKKLTDFNDLQQYQDSTPHLVKQQIQDKIAQIGWKQQSSGGAASTEGGGDDCIGWITQETMMESFRLILTTEDYFDHRMNRVWSHSALIKATPRGTVQSWAAMRERKYCLPEQVGFDPDGSNPDIICNLFDGWPTTPKKGKCSAQLKLLEWLCSHESEHAQALFDYVMDWHALLVQKPGTKMGTSILVHGDQGGGKNMFFGRCMKPMFGKYGIEFGQNAIEDKYNEWMSAKLYGIGNEVIASHESLYHMKGYIKNIITEDVLQIRPMHHSARQERNCLNIVFLSNELQPVHLERGDRRFCVIWTPPTPQPGEDGFDIHRGLIHEVLEELADGGAAAMHHLLLERDISHFHEGVHPPVTRAKEDLIDISLDSKERFWNEWINLEIGSIPVIPATSDLIYELYRLWCSRVGVRSAAPQSKLIPTISKQRGVKKIRSRYLGSNNPVAWILPEYAHEPPDGMTQQKWLSDCMDHFKMELYNYREEKS